MRRGTRWTLLAPSGLLCAGCGTANGDNSDGGSTGTNSDGGIYYACDWTCASGNGVGTVLASSPSAAEALCQSAHPGCNCH